VVAGRAEFRAMTRQSFKINKTPIKRDTATTTFQKRDGHCQRIRCVIALPFNRDAPALFQALLRVYRASAPNGCPLHAVSPVGIIVRVTLADSVTLYDRRHLVVRRHP
jgi:hypothetical protein